jgi:lipopolysaccharide transport system ATP-binding protein
VRYDGPPKGALDLYQANLLKQQSKEGQALTIVEGGESKVGSAPAPVGSQVSEVGTEALNKPESTEQTALESPVVEGLVSALATVEQVRVCDVAGKPTESLVSDDVVRVQIAVRFHAPFADPHVGFKLRDRLGRVIFETNTYCMKTSIGAVSKGALVTVEFAFAVALHPGEYTLSVGVSDSGIMDGSFQQHLAHVHDQAMFAVLQNRDTYQWSGICNLKPSLSIQR